jgi:hypothetical protein
VITKAPTPPPDRRLQDKREPNNRNESRARWRDPFTRTPRPWRAEADLGEPAGRGKLHRPRDD